MLRVLIGRSGREHTREFADLRAATRALMWDVIEGHIAVKALALRGAAVRSDLVSQACTARCQAHHSADPGARRNAMRAWQALLRSTR